MKTVRLLSILFFITLIAFVQCKKEVTNPFDPKCPKELFTPGSFSAVQSETEVILSWVQENVNISNFKIDKKVDSGDWTNIASPPKTAKSYSDLNLEPGAQHEYRLYAVAGTNQSNMVFAQITPVFGANIVTGGHTELTCNSALLGGNITSTGGAPVTEKGVVYATNPEPTTSNNKMQMGSGTGAFSGTVTGLAEQTTFYVRAYAINSAGTSYGNEISFSTPPCVIPPSILTHEATNLTHESAILGGTVLNSGGASVTDRGVVYSTSPNPTTANNKIQIGSGVGGFSQDITGLRQNSTYYVKAYAINSAGTAYGEQIQFTTNCPATITITHSIGAYAPANKTVTYEVVLFNKQCWIAQNLGASNVATAINDDSKAAAGWYWQFNRRQGFSYYENQDLSIAIRTPETQWITAIDEDSDWRQYFGLTLNTDPCRALLGWGWRIPTSAEWGAITGRTPSAMFNSVLKLHAAGYLDLNSGNLIGRGSSTRFWSSTQYNNTQAYGLIPASTEGQTAVFNSLPLNKAYGFPVRCVFE